MPKGAYLVTYADVSDPREARRLLRKTADGKATLGEAMRAIGQLSSGDYVFPESAVILMIGNTQELVDEVAATYNNGVDRIHAQRWPDLEFYYVRMEISGLGPVTFQADTILAIGPTEYWDPRRQDAVDNGWRLLKKDSSVKLEAGRDSDYYLPDLIRKCKRDWTGDLISAAAD